MYLTDRWQDGEEKDEISMDNKDILSDENLW